MMNFILRYRSWLLDWSYSCRRLSLPDQRRHSAFLNLTALGLFLTAGLGTSSLASAQNFPSKPLRYIIPSTPGGGQDLVGRALAPRLSELLGQPVIVDNRPGGSTIIGADQAAHAPADGHTLFMGSNTTLSMNPNLHAKLPYDPIKDFAPISRIVILANMLAVHPSMPVRSVRDLAAFASAHPNQLNYSSSGTGTPAHLAGVMFNETARVSMTHVPYKGSSPALTAVVSGETQLVFCTLTSGLQLIRGHRLRAIAVTSAQRAISLPDLPTIAESGYPGYEVITWYAAMVPAGTPPAIIKRLHSEFLHILHSEEFKHWLISQGGQSAPSSPEELTAQIKKELLVYALIIKKSGMKAD